MKQLAASIYLNGRMDGKLLGMGIDSVHILHQGDGHSMENLENREKSARETWRKPEEVRELGGFFNSQKNVQMRVVFDRKL